MIFLYQGYLRAPGVPMSILTAAESTAFKTKHWLLDAHITADPSQKMRAADCISRKVAGKGQYRLLLNCWSSL
jgi:hypothetical protein